MESGGHVFITGATSGIGLACAQRLAVRGFRVWGSYLLEAERDAARERCTGAVELLPLDVTDSSSIAAAGAALRQSVGRQGLAGLVNNAGVDIPGPLEFLPLEALRRQLEVNVVGQLAVTQALLPLLRQARGRLVFVGSIDGRAVTPFQGAYGASKHAIEAVADVLRMELRSARVQVSLVEPGDIATPFWGKSMALADEMLERLPAEAHLHYGPTMAAARAAAERMARRARPPQTVARAVERALTARRPRSRYLVGSDARLRLALEWLPARWTDRIVMRLISGTKGGVPDRPGTAPSR